jgi:acetyltransferase
MFDPQTIAVIGATEADGTPGRILIDNLLACRQRRVYTVNPHRAPVCALPCYETPSSVPEHIDLAIVATPAPTVPAIVQACGEAGVDGMIIISEGFREFGPEGRLLEEQVKAIRKKYPMRILGPNCLGVIRPHAELCAARLKNVPEKGNIALLTQSSAFGKTLFDWGMNTHVSFSMLASLGSAVDIDFGDLIDYLGNDPHTRSIIIYMEDRIGDIRKFVSAARRFARNKPIVLLKPSPLPNGDRPGLTHTDILAGQTRSSTPSCGGGGGPGAGGPDLYNTAGSFMPATSPGAPVWRS